MRRIEAEIAPGHLEGVKERLQLIGVHGMTVVPCRRNVPTDTLRLDVVVTDDMAEPVVRAILLVLRRDTSTGGVIAVAPLDEVRRISTGASGPDAL